MGAQVRTRQARGEARRSLILDATLAAISARGVAAVTHRVVAAEADVPLGAVTYYFSTLDELLEEALRRFVAQETERLRAVAAGLAAAGGTPEEVADAIVGALAVQAPGAALPQFQLYLEAARRPGLRAAARECLAAYAGVAEAALRAAGSPRAAEGAELFVALVDGMGLHEMATGEPGHLARLRRALLELFAAYAP